MEGSGSATRKCPPTRRFLRTRRGLPPSPPCTGCDKTSHHSRTPGPSACPRSSPVGRRRGPDPCSLLAYCKSRKRTRCYEDRMPLHLARRRGRHHRASRRHVRHRSARNPPWRPPMRPRPHRYRSSRRVEGKRYQTAPSCPFPHPLRPRLRQGERHRRCILRRGAIQIAKAFRASVLPHATPMSRGRRWCRARADTFGIGRLGAPPDLRQERAPRRTEPGPFRGVR